MRHSHPTLGFEKELARSEDYSQGPLVLSGIRHDLIDWAIKVNDQELWLDLGRALVRACDLNDLSSRVSDRFVDTCPPEVFRTLGKGVSPYLRFRGWKKRTDRALGQ